MRDELHILLNFFFSSLIHRINIWLEFHLSGPSEMSTIDGLTPTNNSTRERNGV